MTTAFATIDGHRAASAVVHVPGAGPWFADVRMEGAPELAGRVTLALGALELVGTIDARYDGTRGAQRMMRIVAGGNGWGALLAAKAYHNDARIRALTVAQDAAREAGETLGDFAPELERIGIDYVRQAGPASRVLEDVIGAARWWVDYDGTTHVGARELADAVTGTYELIEFVPDERIAVLAIDDLRAVAIGSVLSDRLDEPQTVRELEIAVDADAVRVRAWCGGADGSRGRLADAIRGIVERVVDRRLHGVSKYRVVQMSGDRVELQVVRRATGLPNALPISMWAGVAGAHADLAPGAECLVQFIDGDRTQPIVTHYAGKDGTGWTPANVVLSASTSLKLGGPNATEHVPLGDALKTWIDGHVHGYLSESSAPLVTTPPITPPYDGITGTPDPSPDPSSKVTVDA